MSDNFNKKWESIRQKGFLHFIFKEGIITGIIYGIIAVALVYIIDNYVLKNTAQGLNINRAITGFILVLASNIVASLIIWISSEKKYKE